MDHEALVRAETWISQTDAAEPVDLARKDLGRVWGWPADPWYTSEAALKELSVFVQEHQGLAEEWDAAGDDDKKAAWIGRVAGLKQTAPELEVPPPHNEPPQHEPRGQVEVVDVRPPPVPSPAVAEQPVRKALFANRPRPVPLYTGGQPGLARLLEGVLEKSTIDEGIAQMYSNLRNNMGLHYVAGSLASPGPITRGETTEGMCQTFRNVLYAGMKEYDNLRKTHPVAAVKDGLLTYRVNDSLSETKFVTRGELTLIGGLKGNVVLEVDSLGGVVNEGYDAVKRFVFSGHWTIEINGRVYDPIFESINGDNVGIRLDTNRIGDGSRFLGTPQPTPGGEFGGSFIWVHDWAKFSGTVTAMRALYTDNRREIDRAVGGRGTPGKAAARAKEIVAKGVADDANFRRVVRLAVSTNRPVQFTAEDATAVDKVIELALLDA